MLEIEIETGEMRECQIGKIGVIYSIDMKYLSGVKQKHFTSGNITLNQLVEGSSPPGITKRTASVHTLAILVCGKGEISCPPCRGENCPLS